MSFWTEVGGRPEPGTRTHATIPTGEYPHGAPIESPVIVVRGAADGPTLWVQGCVHGSEVGGPLGLLRALDRLDPRALRGTIVALPVANLTAYHQAARNTPVDEVNLNRAFPGDPQGTFSARLAATLLGHVLEAADVVLDLHSGGDRAHCPFYALVHDAGNAAAEASLDLARHVGTPVIWKSRETWLDGALFTHATRQGTPAVLVECGGALVSGEQVETFARAVRNALVHLGMLDGTAPVQPRYTYLGTCHFRHSGAGGLFVPAVVAGGTYPAGAPVGTIYDLYGAVRERITGPDEPFYVAAIHREHTAIYSGDFIAECVTIAQTEEPERGRRE